MGTAWLAVFGTLVVASQVSALERANRTTCVPGFESKLVIFRVSRQDLRPGMRLGRVGFTDCTDRQIFLFSTDDSRFDVKADGVLTVNREVVLHKGHQNFFIHCWDSQGHKTTVPVSIVHPEHHHGHHHGHQCGKHHHGNHINYNHQHHSTDVKSANHTENGADPQVPVLQFPKSGGGLGRKKRDWVVPPLSVSENLRGPFPLKVSQVRSKEDKNKKLFYSITGPGADLPPVGRFKMDRETGILYVKQPLDREETDKYTFLVNAVVDGAGQAEDPMKIIVNVIDQNDNKPYFMMEYKADVAEATAIGTEVIRVLAKDDDEPNNANSDIRYGIMNQNPLLPTANMFEINIITGSIRVNDKGFDREKYPQYILTVQAADLEGEGLIGKTKVILTVTGSNDNAPVFTQKSKLDFETTSKHTVLVSVENEIPFAPGVSVVTSTATVVVNVKDVNKAPVFDPKEKLVVKPEDLAVDEVVVQYTASDPDTAHNQKVAYKILNDPAGWLNVDMDTGLIKVRTLMDREAVFVTNDKYIATIGAYDDDAVPATGTGTLIIQLEDVNDNAPIIEQREIMVCNKDPVPQLLSVTDKDGPEFGAPYSVSLQCMSKTNWTTRMNDSRTGIILNLAIELPSGEYSVILRVADKHGLEQESIIKAEVCDCKGEDVMCTQHAIGDSNVLLIRGILGGILLLVLVLVVLFVSLRKGEQKEPTSKDNIYYYNRAK